MDYLFHSQECGERVVVGVVHLLSLPLLWNSLAFY